LLSSYLLTLSLHDALPIFLRVLHFSTRATIAFVMATGFIADAGSLPLLVSNLVNIVTADFFGISFARYALVMVPVGVVSVAASLDRKSTRLNSSHVSISYA